MSKKSILFFLGMFILLVVVATSKLTIENKKIDIVAMNSAPLEPESASPWWINFRTSEGRIMIINRADFNMTIRDYTFNGFIDESAWEIFKVLQEGQAMTIEHHVKVWEIFGHMFTISHHDKLRLKVS